MSKDLDQTPMEITNQIEQEEVKQLDSLNDKAVETEPTTSRWCWGHQWRTIDKEKWEEGLEIDHDVLAGEPFAFRRRSLITFLVFFSSSAGSLLAFR